MLINHPVVALVPRANILFLACFVLYPPHQLLVSASLSSSVIVFVDFRLLPFTTLCNGTVESEVGSTLGKELDSGNVDSPERQACSP